MPDIFFAGGIAARSAAPSEKDGVDSGLTGKNQRKPTKTGFSSENQRKSGENQVFPVNLKKSPLEFPSKRLSSQVFAGISQPFVWTELRGHPKPIMMELT
jgi:hypothetical protein